MKLLMKLIEYAQAVIYYSQFAGCEETAEMAIVEYRSRLWTGIWEFLVSSPRVIFCYFFDHKWDVSSCINGESGSEEFYCNRCGESHNIIYY
jgi:hypothetical protein